MGDNIYDDVNQTEELKLPEHSTVNIFVNANAKHGTESMNHRTTRNPQVQQTGGETTRIRCFRLTVVCLVLLCVLLLTAITVLWIKFNILNAEKAEMETSYNNQTIERDQIQTNYNNLTIERDQLQTRYNTLTIERDELQTRYNTLTIERDQIQKEREDVKKLFNTLGWTYFSSSIYYISNEGKTWTESRENCKGRGTELVTINSREEQEFISKLLGGGSAWIGLNDRVTEGVWKWVDDTPLITGYWGRGEPNSYAGDEDCVLTGEKSDSVWNWADYPCDSRFFHICEKRSLN